MTTKALAELSQQATPGPWFVEYAGDFGDKAAIVADVLRGRYGKDALSFGEDHDTAHFVVALVNAWREGLLVPTSEVAELVGDPDLGCMSSHEGPPCVCWEDHLRALLARLAGEVR